MITLSRRHFLAGSLALGAASAWAPLFRLTRAEASASAGAPPPNFPQSVELYRQAYKNWAGSIAVDDVWTCAPRTPAEVVAVANWAFGQGWRLRPRGKMHGWSPLTLTGAGAARTVLVDTTQHLRSMRMVSGAPAAVAVQTGATMDDLVGYLASQGYGLTTTPAPGDVTVGGVLAVDGHGAAVPARGEARAPGATYGSLSNLILSATAVVWDTAAGRYVLRTFPRSHPDAKALLVHLGRAFLAEVTLQVVSDRHLRCVSFVDIPAGELFAPPASAGQRSFASFLDSYGRVEAIWYPFTTDPWLKVWSLCPTKPLASRQVSSPYNYPFSDNVPDQVGHLADQIISGHVELTPAFGETMYAVTAAGLAATASYDLWGASKNLLLYLKPTTLRVAANGYAVLTRRQDVQRVINRFTVFYQQHVAAYQLKGSYPMSMPVEIRATGLDDPNDVVLQPAETPVLSALAIRRDHSEWDTAVWFDALTFPDTPDGNAFCHDLERWLFTTYTPPLATVRVEWSKGWAYTPTSPYANTKMLAGTIPDAYRAGRDAGDDWDWAVATLKSYDPHGVFTNAFLDALLV